MTKEEFAALRSEDTQFIELLRRVFACYFKTVKEPAFTLAHKTSIGTYLWRVSNVVSDIDQNVTDIKLIESLLKSLDTGMRRLKKNQNNAHLIRYHYENFFLRATKQRDLSLKLINQVMQLGLPAGLGMEKKLVKKLDPNYGKFDVIWGYITQLNDHVKPYRNHLAHHGTVVHKDLTLLNTYYTWDIKLNSLEEEFRHEMSMTRLQKELIDKFLSQISAYLKSSDEVLKMLYLYLAKPFVDQLSSLFE